MQMHILQSIDSISDVKVFLFLLGTTQQNAKLMSMEELKNRLIGMTVMAGLHCLFV